MKRDDATLRQIEAARPDLSTWLSANAGSGKTRVLTDRVARLLLDHVNPQHILCLTYTKAAASEMQNRLFQRLGAWAMLDDAALIAELQTLGLGGPFDQDALRNARRLFARAIETPGGLKIQTIHSFCAGLLRRFPLEAGVSPQFTEMEDRTAALLRAEIVEEIAAGPDSAALYDVARHYSGETFDTLTAEIVRHQSVFPAVSDDRAIAQALDISPDITAATIQGAVFTGDEQALLERMIPAMRAGSATDIRNAERLATLGPLDISALPKLFDLFLTGSKTKSPFSAKTGTFPTKKAQGPLADIMPRIDAWMQRVEAIRETSLAHDTLMKTRALHRFARLFLKKYNTAKQLRGWLDFDDLILRARTLLTRADVAAWVLFRLDGGIDHILVDEAQDTSPVQWQVIERLAQEFTSGIGARSDVLRTIFVVGDKKQSIYSFQGADPREFDRMQSEFAARLKVTDSPLAIRSLEHSFRSSEAILGLVDQCFAGKDDAGFTPDQSHKAFKNTLAGRVDLWPVLPAPETEDDPPWHMPVDVRASNDPVVVLAAQIADTIAGLTQTPHPIPDDRGDAPYPARAIRPGDFLILVQRRSDLFHEIIRACKARDLPIAGADRLRVGGELAVRDLAALLSFLATPEDDLSLAVTLKSPLFGWSEDQLYRLAHGRAQKYLWPELRDRAAEFPEVMAVLNDLRGQVDFLRPYELIERILTRHDGRRKLLSRLGSEAEDGIDALLSQALSYEQKSVGSLTGFLVWMDTDAQEIKRQMDSAGDRIRVMTVHGAKGLEAPIVILPDTGKRANLVRGQVAIAKGQALWRNSADQMPQIIADAGEAVKDEQKAERDRLLYVAMTRAEKWLIVATPTDPGSAGESWYEKIAAGMERSAARPHSFGMGTGLRLEYGDWPVLETHSTPETDPSPQPLAPWFSQPAPAPLPVAVTLSPSDLGGAKALPGEAGLDEDAALRRGRLVHLLLEFLPDVAREDWQETASRLMAQSGENVSAEEGELLFTEADKVLSKPSLRALFGADALSEVPVTAPLADLQGRRVHGTIDRLVIEPERILIVDFKTNALVPERAEACPDGLLRQMGAYSAAISAIYPGRRIDAAILWTRTAELMMLPHDLVSEALRHTQIS